MPTYMLRDIDQDLWDRFKAQAVRDGHGLKYVVLQLFELYALVGIAPIKELIRKKK